MISTVRALLFKLFRGVLHLCAGKGLARWYPMNVLWPRVYKVLIRWLHPPRVTFRGHTINLDATDSLYLSNHDICPPSELRAIDALVRPGFTVVDVGAHIALIALECARLVGAQGTVHAFEPDPSNFALLRTNVAINGYDHIHLHCQAISDRVGRASLYLSDLNHGDHQLYLSAELRSSISVDVTTLDEFLSQSRVVPDFIKLDIQGCEAAAIAGMAGLLSSRQPPPLLLLEFWPLGLRRAGASPEALLRTLHDVGYRLYDLPLSRHFAVLSTISELLLRYPTAADTATNLICSARLLDEIAPLLLHQ
ncbi:MAG: FkbM family methyltransferase [Candidatus Riflebacteria bacterium]|nr:FkbM family methyltransferase [Candidatus Riflebacteria bacterium]